MSTKTIILVEDDKQAMEMYELLFEIAGFLIVGKCNNGEEAIELIKEKKAKVVLLDIGLKGKLTGLDVLREVNDLLKECRVIVVSGYPEHEEASKNLGAFGFIKKPVRTELMMKEFKRAALE